MEVHCSGISGKGRRARRKDNSMMSPGRTGTAEAKRRAKLGALARQRGTGRTIQGRE